MGTINSYFVCIIDTITNVVLSANTLYTIGDSDRHRHTPTTLQWCFDQLGKIDGVHPDGRRRVWRLQIVSVFSDLIKLSTIELHAAVAEKSG